MAAKVKAATGAGRDLRGIASEREDDPRNKPIAQVLQANLVGSTCTAEGLTGRGHAAVLVLCRELIAAGLDPDAALHVYRGTTLALKVRSIAAGAKLTVRDSARGTPIFAKHRPWSAVSGGDVSPHSEFAEGGAP